MFPRLPIALFLHLMIAMPFRAVAADSAPKYETHVRSILKQHCFHCHGEEEHPEGGLDLRLVRFMKQGGDSGESIVPGAPDESLLLERIVDGEMPPEEGKLLSEGEIATIRNWIASGANTVRPEPESITAELYITPEELSHWAYQPITRPSVPNVQNGGAVANPIDAFLLAKLEEQGFGFSPPAKKHTLLRRAYLDMHGLLPSPEAVQLFMSHAHEDEAAWSQVVDQLLSSQRYGERWARHWLDVAGYADSEGYNEADAERAHAWRYRDYVIRSFNRDKPFNQFVEEQLAGDEMLDSSPANLSPEDAERLAATGFLRTAPDGTGGAVPDAQVARNETIADTIKIVTSALMGITVGCAQCHDHRYDPISQADYYRLRAIFEPAFDWQRWRNPSQRLVSLYTDEDRTAAAKIEAEAKKIDALHSKQQAEFIAATFEKQLAKLPPEIHEQARAAHRTPAKERTKQQQAIFKKHPNLNVTAGSLYLYDSKAADHLKQLAEKATKLRASKPAEHFVRALTEIPGRIPVTQLFHRGDHEQPKQELLPAGLTVISKVAEVGSIAADDESLPTTGRRLAFARRLTNRNHPLLARVIVNRVWMHHFGRGLVTTPGDFGALGQPPTHPQLLDWLASEFLDSGGSLKHLHRLILNSNAWQQQVRKNTRLISADPDNQLYGGAELIRLDAEAIRDTILQLSDKLNPKMFGPPVPVMADRVGRWVIGKENLNAGRPGAKLDMHGEEFRRSIYIQVRRSRPLSVLDTFDLPSMSPNCDKRRPSTGAPQSLLMMNSDLLITYSGHMAERLLRMTHKKQDSDEQASDEQANDDQEQQIRTAWQLIYSRAPETGELAAANQFLADQIATFATQPDYQSQGEKPPQRSAAEDALAVLCQMLLSSNEFLYVN